MNLWIKCPVHLHQSDTKRRVKNEQTLQQKRVAIYGIERPMPKVKGKFKVANALGNAIIGNDGVAVNHFVPRINDDAAYRVYGRCNLKEDSALAMRFPQLAFKGVPPQVSVQSFE